ncbi:MAG: dephospho-CoA kinase [Planctomycetota bacterium]
MMHIYPPQVDRTGRPLRRGVVVGIAGPIAAGKSTVSLFLAGLGAREIDADAICHHFLRSPEIVAKIVDIFGPEVLDANGQPDRWKIGRLAFDCQERISRLNDLLHPLLVEEIEREIQEARREGVMLVINAALLFETGISDYCDYIITVTADKAVREARAISKRGWPEGEMERREAFLLSLEHKIANSHFVIHNNGNYEELQKEVVRVYKEIVNG